MELDKYRVDGCKHPITILDSFMEFPKLTTKPGLEKLERNPKKVNVRKGADHNYEHSRI